MKRFLFVGGLALALSFSGLLGPLGRAPVGAAPAKLHALTALLEDEATVYATAFENRTGIRLELVRKSTGVILALLRNLVSAREDGDAMPVDLIFGGPADTYVVAAREGFLSSYKSQQSNHIPPGYRDPDGMWAGIYLGIIGFAYNPGRLQRAGLAPPMAWEDLLSRKLRGEVMMANPVSSGTGYTILATMVQLLGEAKGMAYMEALNRNVRTYTDTGATPGRLVGLGEAAVGVLFAHDVLKFQKQGFDVKLAFPREGTGYEIGAVAVTSASRNASAARRFVDFMLSAEGQGLYSAMGEFRLPTNRYAPLPAGAVSLSQVKTVDYDVTWAGLSKERLTKRWLKDVYLRSRSTVPYSR